MSYTVPSISDFQQYFARDFPFQPIGTPDLTLYIQDSDIQKGLDMALGWVNQALFSSQTDFTIGYELMSAHCMVMNLRASSLGLSGKFDWATGSKSVGSVSISQAIPAKILDNPTYAWIAMSNYGVTYLTMVLPSMSGYVFAMQGATQA